MSLGEFGLHGIGGIEDESSESDSDDGDEAVGGKRSHGLHGEGEEGDKENEFFEERDKLDTKVENDDASDAVAEFGEVGADEEGEMEGLA